MAKFILPSIEQLRQHIEDLVRKHEVLCSTRLRRPGLARAIHASEHDVREIEIAPIRSIFSYAAALHELGHTVGPHQRSKQTATRERWAWDWARKNALVWTDAMERYSQKYLLITAR